MSFEIKQTFERHSSSLWKYYSLVTFSLEFSLQSGATTESQPAGPCLQRPVGHKELLVELCDLVPKAEEQRFWKQAWHTLLQNSWRDKIDPIRHCLMSYRFNATLWSRFLRPIISISCVSLCLTQQVTLFSNFPYYLFIFNQLPLPYWSGQFNNDWLVKTQLKRIKLFSSYS